jgi:hypothetical protein
MRSMTSNTSKSSLAKLLRSLGAAVVMSMAFTTPAHAQLGLIYGQLLDMAEQYAMKAAMAQMGLGIEGAVAQAGAATRAEVLKAAAADKAVNEGLEAYRQQQNLQKLAIKTSASLEQPATTCQTIAAQGGIGTASQNAKAKVFTSQTRTMKKVAGNTNTAQVLETSYKTTNQNLCTPEEAARGICKVSTDSRYANLAGADQNAAYLFQSKDGSTSYEGGKDGAQAEAAQSYIDRVIAGVPPEQLRKVDYSKSPQGRAYTELTRRYSAVLSMSAYSLTQIKEARNPQVGLGTATQMATVSVPGFEKNKADMSMLEAVQRLVATKFSPESMASAARATSPNLILRDMAQMASFQLWVDHQTLLQDTRTEALMAHQLALLTEQTLRPQLEAQRTAATRGANAARQ